jgi:hypothetical protein
LCIERPEKFGHLALLIAALWWFVPYRWARLSALAVLLIVAS